MRIKIVSAADVWSWYRSYGLTRTVENSIHRQVTTDTYAKGTLPAKLRARISGQLAFQLERRFS